MMIIIVMILIMMMVTVIDIPSFFEGLPPWCD